MVNESDITFTTHVYKSTIYFMSFTIQIAILQNNYRCGAAEMFLDFSDCSKSIIDLDI